MAEIAWSKDRVIEVLAYRATNRLDMERTAKHFNISASKIYYYADKFGINLVTNLEKKNKVSRPKPEFIDLVPPKTIDPMIAVMVPASKLARVMEALQ